MSFEVSHFPCKIPFNLGIEARIVRGIMDILRERAVSIGVVSADDDGVFYRGERSFYIYVDTHEESIDLSVIRELVGDVEGWRFKAIEVYVTEEGRIGIKLFVEYALHDERTNIS